MATTDATGAHDAPRLEHFPISYLSIVMGLSGLAIAAHKAAAALGATAPWVPPLLSALGLIAAAAFVVIAALYALKALRHPSAVAAEFAHPIKLHFFPTISISLLLLAIVALPHAPGLANGLFLIGGPLQLVFTLAVLNSWFNRTHYEMAHLNPAWFIPIVGNVVAPIVAAPLGYLEAGWFFFSIGIVFWIVLFSIIVNRVLFHHPIPEKLAPTLFILVAPPAVGFLSYLRLGGDLDAFARVLVGFTLFMTLFMATQAPRLMRMRFFLSWWAYSFPLAAATTASFAMAERSGSMLYLGIGSVLLGVLTAVVAGLSARTLLAVTRHEICQPE